MATDPAAQRSTPCARRVSAGWRYDWVLDLDIRAFFDTIPHDLLLKALRAHTACRWVLALCGALVDGAGAKGRWLH